MNPVKGICCYEFGSRMGSFSGKHIFLYADPVQSDKDAAGERMIYDVRDFGAVPDGKTDVSEYIQNAINTCTAEGGGIIYLRGGIFLSGMIELKNGTELYIESDAVLEGLTDSSAYPSMTSEKTPNWNMLRQGPRKALVYADNVDNLIIRGGGSIDGSGDFPGDYGSESSRPSCRLRECQNTEYRCKGCGDVDHPSC